MEAGHSLKRTIKAQAMKTAKRAPMEISMRKRSWRSKAATMTPMTLVEATMMMAQPIRAPLSRQQVMKKLVMIGTRWNAKQSREKMKCD